MFSTEKQRSGGFVFKALAPCLFLFMTYFELGRCLWDFCPLPLQACFQDALRGQLLPSLPWSQVRQVKTITVHPHFNMLSYDSDMLSYDSDIALVQLDVPLEYNAAEASVSAQQHRDVFFLFPLHCVWMGAHRRRWLF